MDKPAWHKGLSTFRFIKSGQDCQVVFPNRSPDYLQISRVIRASILLLLTYPLLWGDFNEKYNSVTKVNGEY